VPLELAVLDNTVTAKLGKYSLHIPCDDGAWPLRDRGLSVLNVLAVWNTSEDYAWPIALCLQRGLPIACRTVVDDVKPHAMLGMIGACTAELSDEFSVLGMSRPWQ